MLTVAFDSNVRTAMRDILVFPFTSLHNMTIPILVIMHYIFLVVLNSVAESESELKDKPLMHCVIPF